MSVNLGLGTGIVQDWLEQQLPESWPPFEFAAIPGGRSNLTYAVRDRVGARWVLRRPPLGGVLPSAHDVGREYAFLSALAGTAVPVPPTRAFCDDASVIGAPFYVMDFVEGRVLGPRASAEYLPENARRRVGPAMAAALAELHAVDAERAGLGHFGRPERYMERQIRRWSEQWRSTGPGNNTANRTVELVARRLASRLPRMEKGTVVHGDFRLGNLILDDRGGVSAILDWEMATRGDPLADVGLMLAHWSGPGDPSHPLASAPDGLDGFHSREELAQLYGEASGRDLRALDWYTSFAFWKIAVIVQGMHARASAGAYGADAQHENEDLPGVVERFLDHAKRLSAGPVSTSA